MTPPFEFFFLGVVVLWSSSRFLTVKLLRSFAEVLYAYFLPLQVCAAFNLLIEVRPSFLEVSFLLVSIYCHIIDLISVFFLGLNLCFCCMLSSLLQILFLSDQRVLISIP